MPFYSDNQGSCESYDYNNHRGVPVKAPTTSAREDRKPYIHLVELARDSDFSPSTSLYPRSSVDTYDSTIESEEDLSLEREEDVTRYRDPDYIPPLPSYIHEIEEPNVRPSSPKEFARLFPSMNRLSIRHDDFTTDGNMNLRVDTVVPGRSRTAVQLFHLRMYDLAKRDSSLRRYCRESGREVCNSKRTYLAPTPTSRPTLQRSMSSAMKTLSGAARPAFRRQNSSSSTISSGKRPATAHSFDTSRVDASCPSPRAFTGDYKPHSQPRATNAIKLEFSNYARVDVERKGVKNSKRYEFSWWGHHYAWKRVAEKHMDGVVSFHLIRDGQSPPIAHIVPETRSPNQVEDDERAGGWVPPCYMWINDKSVLDAATDVADVIVAAGLMALVDNCIKERWQTKKMHRLPALGDMGSSSPRSFMQRVFSQRRASSDHPHSPLRYTSPIPSC